jgi:hypothetical protein
MTTHFRKSSGSESVTFFNSLKVIAPQLNRVECWSLILRKAMEAFFPEKPAQNEKWLPT